MTQNKFDYPTEIIIFSSLLYNCSPKEYRLLRDGKKYDFTKLFNQEKTNLINLCESFD